MSQGPARQPQRTLHLHAGPHKTGSTYLQARLQRNRRSLERLGLRYPLPWGEHSHRHLARQLRADGLGALEKLLQQQRRWSGDVLLSAEHFVPLLAQADSLEALQRCCESKGFALHVISVVRPQHALLNSFYAHVLGRLYATPSFTAYVRAQLACRRLRGPARRRWIHLAPLSLDLERRFECLLVQPGLRSSFLPFVPRRHDLFDQLVESLGLPPQTWRPAPAAQANEQLGRRGLGLAYLLNAELDSLPIRRSGLIAEHGLNRLVEQLRILARQRGWVKERYSGWQGRLLQRFEQHYAASNDRFAQQVWGQNWLACFAPPPPPSESQGLVLDQELRQEARRLFTDYRCRLPQALR